MNVLYVTGACLTKNTSANMSHNAFVQGLLEYGCDVDIIMASDSWGAEDKALPRWERARYFEYNSTSFAEVLRKAGKRSGGAMNAGAPSEASGRDARPRTKSNARAIAKKAFYTVFRPDPVYPLHKTWLKNAARFFSDKRYDLILSNSSPAASHRLVSKLTKAGHIHYDRWVQIWEDPWYYDLYGGNSEAIRREEHELLREASEICYVSPLTLMYQKEFFPDCSGKMKCVPLPFLALEGPAEQRDTQKGSFGYFGDYYSKTRNIAPFYDALKDSGYSGYIFGDSDVRLAGTERIEVSGRVTLDVLSAIQDKTEVLVHLCNLKGGQIPGKVYHYSATDKPVLFILDGTDSEIESIRSFFEPFHRYCFCRNEKNAIRDAMDQLVNNGRKFEPVQEFSPVSVVARIIEGRTDG